MSLIDLYSPDFHDEVKSKGREIHRRGSVRILASGPAAVFAKVEDQGIQSTHLKWEIGKGAKYSCSCPYFQGHGDPCKHAWATVLRAASDKLLPDPEKLVNGHEMNTRLVIPKNDSDPREGEEELSKSHFRPGWTTPRKSKGLGQPSVDPVEHPRPDPLAWKKQFSKLTQSMVNGSAAVARGISPCAGRGIILAGKPARDLHHRRPRRKAAAKAWPSSCRTIRRTATGSGTAPST